MTDEVNVVTPENQTGPPVMEAEAEDPEVWVSPSQAFMYLSEKLPPQDFTTSPITFYSWIHKGAIQGAVLMGEGRGARILLPLSEVKKFRRANVPRKRAGRPMEPEAQYSKYKHLAGTPLPDPA